MKQINASLVANEFLQFARQDNKEINSIKLESLLFYAQAWHLAIHDKILFSEDIEAWECGPVVKSVYNQCRIYFGKKIEKNLRFLIPYKNEKNYIDAKWSAGVLNDDYEKEKKHIKEIWKSHKNLTDIQLCNSTHAEGEPWTLVKNLYLDDLYIKPVIPINIIRDVFKSKMK